MKYFLICGGGTGAKVAEAYIHLCAAGCGPEELHLLLLDADTDNGNVARTTETINVYNRVRPWGWRVQPNRTGAIELFHTRIFPYFLTERVSDVIGGTLGQTAAGDAELRDVLDLLYDEEEQAADNQFGFLARPNLGSLILAEHLQEKLTRAPGGVDFMNQLRSALGSQPHVQVAVVGSIFGGTGASLMPIARESVVEALGDEVEEQNRQRISFGAVMLLPYFSPKRKVTTVDPARFQLDTSLALQYYGLSQFALETSYERIYLVGSDSPSRESHQLTRAISGGRNQVNPAFVEEWVAALGLQHFSCAGAPGPGQRSPVFLYHSDHPSLTWENLPWKKNSGSPDLTERMSYLLHLAAFFLRPQASTSGGLSAGLSSLLNQNAGRPLEFFAWFDTLLDAWGKQHYPEYQNAANSGNAERWQTLHTGVGQNSVAPLQADLGEYFTRLLGWAFHALRSPGIALMDSPTAARDTRDYARLHSGMCDVHPDEIAQDVPTDTYRKDNPLARLVRAALVAMIKDDKNAYTLKALGDSLQFRHQESRLPQAVVPYIQPADLKQAAEEIRRPSAYQAHFGQD